MTRRLPPPRAAPASRRHAVTVVDGLTPLLQPLGCSVLVTSADASSASSIWDHATKSSIGHLYVGVL